MRFLGMSLCCPDPFDKRRDEEAITRRMTGTRHQVNDLLQEGWEVYTVDEVRVEHEAETRRMWLPRGRRKRLYVDREKASQSFFRAPGLTTRKMRIYPIEGNQNTEQSHTTTHRSCLIPAIGRLGLTGCGTAQTTLSYRSAQPGA